MKKNILRTIISSLAFLFFMACEPPTEYKVPPSSLSALVPGETLTTAIIIDGTETQVDVLVEDYGSGIPKSLIIEPGTLNIEIYIIQTETLGIYQLDFNHDGLPDMYLRNLLEGGLEFNTTGNGQGDSGTAVLDGSNAFIGFDTSGDGTIDLDVNNLPLPPEDLIPGQMDTLESRVGTVLESLAVMIMDGDGDGRADAIVIEPDSIHLWLDLGITSYAGVYNIDLNWDGTPELYLRNMPNQGIQFNTQSDGSGSRAWLVFDDAMGFLGFDTSGDGLINIDINDYWLPPQPMSELVVDGSYGTNANGSTGPISTADHPGMFLHSGSDDMGNYYYISYTDDSTNPVNHIIIQKFDSNGYPDTGFGNNSLVQWDYKNNIADFAGLPSLYPSFVFASTDLNGYSYIAIFSTDILYGGIYIIRFDSMGMQDQMYQVNGSYAGTIEKSIKGMSYFTVIHDDIYIHGDMEEHDTGTAIYEYYTGLWKLDKYSMQPDTGWGQSGMARLQNPFDTSTGLTPMDTMIGMDGLLYQTFYYYDSATMRGIYPVVRLTTQGSVDSTFGINGVIDTAVLPESQSGMLYSTHERIILLNTSNPGTGTDVIITGIDYGGQIDSSYGGSYTIGTSMSHSSTPAKPFEENGFLYIMGDDGMDTNGYPIPILYAVDIWSGTLINDGVSDLRIPIAPPSQSFLSFEKLFYSNQGILIQHSGYNNATMLHEIYISRYYNIYP